MPPGGEVWVGGGRGETKGPKAPNRHLDGQTNKQTDKQRDIHDFTQNAP